MSKTYLLGGASSKMAMSTAKLLQEKGNKVIGLSTKDKAFNYDDFYRIEKYDFNCFPKISEAINGLVYFPGTINLKPFARFNPEDFKNDYAINTLGAIAFTQAYITNLKLTSNSSIVFISSVAARTGLPFHSSISASKAALEGFAVALAAEFAPSIRVNCVAPSLVNTTLGEKFINTPEKQEAMEKRNPLKKIGSAEDMANIISFLLNDDSAWITGQTIAVDGGMKNLKL